MISKKSANVTVASKMAYALLWQFFNTNKFKKNVNIAVLYYFSGLFESKLYCNYTETMKHFANQIQDDWMPPLILEKACFRIQNWICL